MNDLLMVVVCYKKNVEDITYLKRMEGVEILIHDNSPEPQVVDPQWHYIHDPHNPGVSKAYNRGIDLARKLNLKGILLLDHDTVFSPEILKSYREALSTYGEDYLYAPMVAGNGKVYSPFVEGKIRNSATPVADFVYSAVYSLEGKSLINSGLLLPLKVVDAIGGFYDTIKLDFSDIAFISKYKAYKKECILVKETLLHGLSGDEGMDKERELGRFRYYCNGAREFGKAGGPKGKLSVFVLFRMLRLMVKYKTLRPLPLALQYYGGEKTL